MCCCRPNTGEYRFGAEGFAVPEGFLDRQRMLSALQTLWSINELPLFSISHGDAHLGNTYVGGDGQPAFLDWQCVHTGHHMHDVAYFVGGALSVADRRASERDLLRDYQLRLASFGGPALSFDAAWRDYQQQSLYGAFWVFASPKMQPPERISAMSERHVAALNDHDSLNAVLSDPRA